MPNLGHKKDLVRAEVVYWLIDRPGTGQVINKLNTCLNAHIIYFLYKTSPVRTLCVPSAMDIPTHLKSEGM